MHVGRWLPVAEPRAGPGAGGAPLLAVHAVVEAELLLEMEGDVFALLVLVADHVMRTGDDTASATGAQSCGDDLRVELLPLGSPAGGLGGGVGHVSTLGDRRGDR